MRWLLLMVLGASVSLSGCGSGSTSSADGSLRKQADLSAIRSIEVRWHQASSTKDIALMMSLWSKDATFTVGSVTYTGLKQIHDFFVNDAAPFQSGNTWISDTPAYKTRVTVNGDKGTLYFECDYVDVKSRVVKAVVSADQDVARIGGRWLITRSVAATPELTANPY